MSNFEKAANKWLEKHPYLNEVAALGMAIENVLDGVDVIKTLPNNIDNAKEQYNNGVSLLLTDIEFNLSDTAGNILLKLALLQDNNSLPEDIKAESKKLSEISVDDAKKLITSVIKNDADTFQNIVEKSKIKEDLLLYFAWVSIRKALSGIKEPLNTWVNDNPWQKGVCPVCAQDASNAFFKHTKRGRQRFLHCDHCGTEWVYKRMGCAYCDNIDQKKMSIKDSEDEPNMRIDLCHKCNTYLKTYIGEDKNSLGKEGWATIHLDILMKDSGFNLKGSLIKPE